MRSALLMLTPILLTACGTEEVAEQPQAPATEEIEATASGELETSSPVTSEADETAPAANADSSADALNISGTVESIVGSEALLVVRGDDGSGYVAYLAKDVVDAILDSDLGVGSKIKLECVPSDWPADDGYVSVDDCRQKAS